MRKGVILGAGNVGRGFIAELFHEAGLEVVFLDINETLLTAINTHRGYRQLVMTQPQTEKWIDHVRAVHSGDRQAAAREIADCDIAATAVGARVLPAIAPVLAAGLQERWANGCHTPLNILICENLLHADTFLRQEVCRHLPADQHDRLAAEVGFVETSIGRMIPVMTPDMMDGQPALICVEPYRHLPADKDAFRGELPDIPMLVPFSPFSYYVERKLYIHNMGHLICALLGRRKGYTYTWQAAEDADIHGLVRAAMTESAMCLSLQYQMDARPLYLHVDDLLRRFANKALGDTNERVGRDLARKLMPGDRLLGAARMCLAQQWFPAFIGVGLAAALLALPSDYTLQADCGALLTREVAALRDCMQNGFCYRSVMDIVTQFKHLSGGDPV